MIKKAHLINLLSALIALFVCPALRAAEPVTTHTVNVGDFHTLRIQDNVNVVYHAHPDTTGVVTYRCSPGFEDAFILTNSNGNLRVQVSTKDVGRQDLPVLHVYSNTLQKVENYSDFHVEISDLPHMDTFVAKLIGNGSINISDVDTDLLKLSITAGNGTITVTGHTDTAAFRMTGTGSIQSSGLLANDVNCRIFGGGTISCHPERLLSVHGIGSTTINYTGDPMIRHRGGGHLNHL